MNALRLECTSRTWWGTQWVDSWPFAITTAIQTNTRDLPNAPVTVYVMTPDPLEAARLLRLAADRLEREPALLFQLEHTAERDFEGAPF